MLTPAVNPPTEADVAAWLNHNFGPDRNVTEQALVLAEEVGELCRALVKRSQGVRGTAEEWTAEIRKEAADALIALLAISSTEGFSLYAEAAERWQTVSARDFRADPLAHGIPDDSRSGSETPEPEPAEACCDRKSGHPGFCMKRCAKTAGCTEPVGHRGRCTEGTFNQIVWRSGSETLAGGEGPSDHASRVRSGRA